MDPPASFSWFRPHTWPPELKAFFVDWLLAICIMAYAGDILGLAVYVFTDDLKDWFWQFKLAVLQIHQCGLFRLDPATFDDAAADKVLAFVMQRVMAMGVSPSSGWAQRLLTEATISFEARLADAATGYWAEAERSSPRFAEWMRARRRLSLRTGRNEARLNATSPYTDDTAHACLGPTLTVRALVHWYRHVDAPGIGALRAAPHKRFLGVSAPFIGGSALTIGLLAFVSAEKSFRTAQQLAAALDGTISHQDFVSLVGLLNSLVCILMVPYFNMYGVYSVLDATRKAKVPLHGGVVVPPDGRKALRRWLEAVRDRAGSSALGSVFHLPRPCSSAHLPAMLSDAAKDGVDAPSIFGHLYGMVWNVPLIEQKGHLELPVVATEMLGGLFNCKIFGPILAGAPCSLVLDALVVPLVIAGKAGSPLTQFLHEELLAMPEYQGIQSDLFVEHLYGPFNPVADAGSRNKPDQVAALLRHMGLAVQYMAVPTWCFELLDRTVEVWRGLTAEERATTRAFLNSASSGPSPHVEPTPAAASAPEAALQAAVAALHARATGLSAAASSSLNDPEPVVRGETRGRPRRSTPASAEPVPPTAGPCLLYTSPSPRDRQKSRMPSSA